ncbi:hypothetical protein CDD83_1873 [Cordyceps sp. RAO-2017]|nr:hypothetical protein CDD83_1873 [Cordyceps sp. RAO-2017]
MRPHSILGTLTLSSVGFALSDSSAWLVASTSRFQDAGSHNQIQTSSEALKHTNEILSACPTDKYLIITQPGIRAKDLRRADGCSMPHLCRATDEVRMKGRFSVAEVVGSVDHAMLSEYIRSGCDKKGKPVVIDEIHLATLSSDDRARTLFENDATLSGKLQAVAKHKSYTILLLSAPSEPAYQADFDDSVHMVVKRDMNAVPLLRRDNNTQWENLPLFQKYQFFTPGIFMGIFVALVLLSILSVGLRALSSLEVSYGAFEKEMGPAAQKKQQ